jgi:MoxR-like ATPase
LDRFIMMIKLSYPSYEAEVDIIKKTTSTIQDEVAAILGKEEILKFQQLVRQVPVVDNVIEYAVSLVQKTRPGEAGASEIANEFLEWGAGPRAGQFLILGAKCNAILSGKYTPDIEDVQAIATPILRHRIMRNFKAEAEGMSEEAIISKLL